MGKPSAPTPPDPVATAGAQTAQNIGTAIANANLSNVNQLTPQGALNYEQTGSTSYTDPATGETYDIPQYTMTQTLNDNEQGIYDQGVQARSALGETATNVSQGLRDHLSQGLDISSLPQRGNPNIREPQLQSHTQGLQNIRSNVGNTSRASGNLGNAGDIRRGYQNDFSADRQRVEDSLMGRLNQNIEQDRAALEGRMMQSGLEPGTEAYDRAMSSHNDASQEARTQAILAAGQEQSRLTNLAAQEASFGNQAQAQQFGQNLAGGQFGNQAVAQNFGQDVTRAGFQNSAVGQANAQQNAAIGANNQNQMMQYGMDVDQFNRQNATRDRSLQEALMMRNQPLNEVSALMSGSQVSMPQFGSTSMPSIATTDQAGLTMANYGQQMQNYNTRMGAYNNLVGGLAGLGSAGIGLM